MDTKIQTGLYNSDKLNLALDESNVIRKHRTFITTEMAMPFIYFTESQNGLGQKGL